MFNVVLSGLEVINCKVAVGVYSPVLDRVEVACNTVNIEILIADKIRVKIEASCFAILLVRTKQSTCLVIWIKFRSHVGITCISKGLIKCNSELQSSFLATNTKAKQTNILYTNDGGLLNVPCSSINMYLFSKCSFKKGTLISMLISF